MNKSLGRVTHPQLTTVRTILLAMVLMISLMAGVLSVQVFGRKDANGPPECDAEPVLKSLHALLGDVALSIRDVRRVSADSRAGHQICYARIGTREDARQIKYALHRDSAEQAFRMEVVMDNE